MKKKAAITISILAVTGLVAWGAVRFFMPEPTVPVQPGETGVDREADDEDRPDIEVVAEGLSIPWEVVFLPEGDMLVTERPGTIQRIGSMERQYNIGQVHHEGEGGLLGMALHPDFSAEGGSAPGGESNRYLYIYLTVFERGGIANRVERYVYTEEGEMTEREVILEGIPGARFHDGGRIAFGPDGYLYVPTGDALVPNLAQDTNSLAGKILRVNDDGSIPEDNPFGNEVYSYGHRNPQGLAWDSEGRLWSTEHGPTARDELNLIEAGRNYGWPNITGTQTASGMVTPVAQSGNETWAPSGAAYYDGSIFFAGLRGGSLYEAVTSNGSVDAIIAHFDSEYGRLRNVAVGPGGHLYILTSNTDGRGRPIPEDDRIIRVNPKIFR